MYECCEKTVKLFSKQKKKKLLKINKIRCLQRDSET